MKKIRSFIDIRMPKGYDIVLHAAILLLMVFGSLMIVSTSVGEVGLENENLVRNTILKQIIFVAVSYFSMVKLAKNYYKWKKNARFNQMYLTLGLFIIVLFLYTLQSAPVYGASRWINVYNLFTIQISEFGKVYLIVLFGLYANWYSNRKVDLIQYMRIPLVFFVIFVILIALQPDFGMVLTYIILFLVMFIIPSHGNLVQAQKLAKFGLFAIVGSIALSATEVGVSIFKGLFKEGSFRVARITQPANPFIDLLDSGFNISYSLFAIASGGLLGLGLGSSKQKYGHLPEATTDFIFSVIIEEIGIFGLIIIVVGYTIILQRLFYYAKRSKSDGYRVILVGTAMYLAIHFVFNIGGVGALIPLTGIPLLFLSSGGSSLLAISMLLGICQSIIVLMHKQAKRNVDTGGSYENRRRQIPFKSHQESR